MSRSCILSIFVLCAALLSVPRRARCEPQPPAQPCTAAAKKGAVDAAAATQKPADVPGKTAHAPTVIIEAPPPWTTHRPDGHAPSGVMADHMHVRGEAMLGYRLMYMDMAGMLEGTKTLTRAELFARGYKMLPESMSMQMHMVNGMIGLSPRVTLTVMVPVTSLSMEMVSASGMRSSMHATGLGDVEASALFGIVRWMGMGLHAGLGVVAPTGSTNVRADDGTPLAYPMQLGSGTWGAEPSLTWVGQRGPWSWGSQILGVVRMGRNGEGYRLGDRLDVNAWGARRLGSFASLSARLEATDDGAITGTDSRLSRMAPKMMPTADPAARGGFALLGYLGINLRVPSGLLARHRIAVEVGLPLFQALAGPQLARSWSLTVDWQYTH